MSSKWNTFSLCLLLCKSTFQMNNNNYNNPRQGRIILPLHPGKGKDSLWAKTQPGQDLAGLDGSPGPLETARGVDYSFKLFKVLATIVHWPQVSAGKAGPHKRLQFGSLFSPHWPRGGALAPFSISVDWMKHSKSPRGSRQRKGE